MTVSLSLSPQLERILAAEAARLGLLLDAYMLQVFEKHAQALLEKDLGAEAEANRQVGAARPRRQPGIAKGLIRIAGDFDAPLEDFEPYR